MKTGIIGLGAMGAGMARNFHKAGLLHRIWNRSAARAETLRTELGVEIAPSIAELAAECELVVTCVSRDPDLLEVVGRVHAGIQPDAIVADTSTVSADTARAAAAILSAKGAHFLDCPVSGGTEGAERGTLAMMVGGEEAVLERARPALAAIAKSIVRIGPVGAGQSCKAVNQLMIAGIYESVAEALAFGASMGLEMEKVIEVISGGAAGSWVLSNRGRNMIAHRFSPGFRVALHHKDLEICRRMAETTDGAWLPVAERMLENYRRLMDAGYGDEDVSAVYRLKEKDHTER